MASARIQRIHEVKGPLQDELVGRSRTSWVRYHRRDAATGIVRFAVAAFGGAGDGGRGGAWRFAEPGCADFVRGMRRAGGRYADVLRRALYRVVAAGRTVPPQHEPGELHLRVGTIV